MVIDVPPFSWYLRPPLIFVLGSLNFGRYDAMAQKPQAPKKLGEFLFLRLPLFMNIRFDSHSIQHDLDISRI